MPDLSPSIFNERAAQKLRSPDDLDKYIKVTNPSVWVVLAACAALLAGLLAWGFFGSVSTSVTTTALNTGQEVLCFLDADVVAQVKEGDPANIGGTPMRVAKVNNTPLSRSEAWEVVESDYLVAALLTEGDWGYAVFFEGDASNLDTGIPLTCTITTEQIVPISLIIGSQS